MNHPHPTTQSTPCVAQPPAIRPRRRRALPLASAAALGITTGMTGCGMLPSATPAAATLSPQQQAADQRVRAFTSDIESALDNVDRDRLRAAAEKKSPAAIPASASAAAPATVSPPAATPAIAAPPAAAASAEPKVPEAPAPAPAKIASASAGPAIAPTDPAPAPASPIASPVTSTIPVLLASAGGEGTPAPAKTAPPRADSPQPAATPAAASAETPSLATAAPTRAAGETELFAPLNPPRQPAPAQSTPAPTAPVSTITPQIPPVGSAPSAMGAMTAVIAVDESPAEPPSAALPAAAPVPMTAEPSLDEALGVIRKKIAAHPTVGTALALALLDTDGKSDEGDITKKLSDPDQKVLGDLIAALQTMQSPAAPAATISERAAPLVDAAKKWQSDADLALPKLVLATRVDSFGVYTAIDPKFEQGRRHTVIIYCEVANFASKKSDDGWFTTHLSQQETLITEDGLLVWRPNAEDVEDRSLNQRHDFYLVKKLTIPENLAAGKYTLRMSVTDKTTNKISMMSIPVEITAK